MAKKNIKFVLILMSLALTGLIIMQYYWISTGVETNKEQFSRDVISILDAVVREVEKQDALYLTKSKIDKIENDFYSLETDSLGTARWKEQQTIRIRQSFSSEKLEREGLAYEVEEEAVISTTGIARKNRLDNETAENLIRLNPGIEDLIASSDTLRYTNQLSPSQTIRLVQKSNLVSSILNEMIVADSSKLVQDRISMSTIDSLIQLEMKNKGIDIDYQFGVIDYSIKGNPQFIYSNQPEIEKNLINSVYKSQLFPSDYYENFNYLCLNFPDRNKYIFTELISVLIASAGFIILIAVGFAVAIFTILRQKRISDITKDFISNMTHELKTPIATVSLACEALMDPDIRKMPTQGGRYLSMIREENNRLALQVEKVLQIARLDRGDFKLKIVTIDIHRIINTAVRNINIQLEQRDGTISTTLDAVNPYIEGDEVHIANIINNLLDNANKYSPEVPELTIKTVSGEKGVRIFVSDKGQGISKDMINKIFDKFYRVPTGNLHDVKGFGLGLSYVKTIVEAHYGNISVKSELGKGSTFIIFLPYKHEQS